MARHWRRTLFATVAGLIVLLAAIGVGRHWLAEQALVWQLEAEGFGPSSANVRHLWFDRIEIAGLEAGNAVSVGVITITPDGWALANWNVDLTNIGVQASYRDGEVRLGPYESLSQLLGGEGDSDLPALSAHNITVNLDTGDGATTLALPGTIQSGKQEIFRADTPFWLQGARIDATGRLDTTATADGAARVEATIDRIAVRADGREIVGGDISLTGDVQTGFADLQIRGDLPEQAVSLDGRIIAGAPFDQPVTEATLLIKAGDLNRLRQLLPSLPDLPGEAEAELSFDGVIRLAGLASASTMGDAAEGDWSLKGTATLGEIKGVAQRTSLDMNTAGDIRDGVLSARIRQAEAGLSGLDPAMKLDILSDDGVLLVIGDDLVISADTGATISGLSLPALLLGEPEGFSVDGRFRATSLGELVIEAETTRAEADGVQLQRVSAVLSAVKGEGDLDTRRGGRLVVDAERAAFSADGVRLVGATAEAHGLTAGGDLGLGKDSTVRITADIAEFGSHGVLLVAAEASANALSGSEGLAAPGGDRVDMQADRLEIADEAARLNAATVRFSGLPDGGMLSLTGSGSTTPDSSEFRGELAYHADKAGNARLTFRKVDVHLPVVMTADRDGGSIRGEGGSVTVAAGPISQDIALAQPTRLGIAIESQPGPCTLNECVIGQMPVRVSLMAETLDLLAEGVGDVALRRIRAALAVKGLAGSRGIDVDLDLRLGQASAASLGSAEGIRVRGPVNLDRPILQHRITAEKVETRPIPDLPLPAFSLDGKALGSLSDARFEGQMTPLTPGLPPARIVADRESITGRIDSLSVARLAEMPLAEPWLPEGFSEPQGNVAVEVEHFFGSNVTRMDLNIQEAGGNTEVADLSGINGALRFASLSPVSTNGVQTLTVNGIDAGLILSDLTAALAINADGEGIIADVRTLAASALGGRISFEPVTIQGAGRPPQLVLNLEGVSLQALTDLLNFSDFSMQGSVSGRVPFAIDQQNRIAISDARLAADGPGVMKLDLNSLRGSLSESMGDQADLLLVALKDFHYSRLTATVEKPFDANEKASIRLEGRNPEHLDGQPFIFNISLNSNVVRLADTVLALYRATLGEIQALARKAMAEE